MSRNPSPSPLPPLLLAACPLPPRSGQSPVMQLPELPEGLTAAEDRAHMEAFRLPAERDKRHLARLLLAVLLHRAAITGLSPLPSLDWYPLPQLFHHAAQARRFFARHACPRLHRLPSGRPWLKEFSVSFSYSEQAAFCLLAGTGTRPGVDAEALSSPAPPASAFSPKELSPVFLRQPGSGSACVAGPSRKPSSRRSVRAATGHRVCWTAAAAANAQANSCWMPPDTTGISCPAPGTGSA